MPKRDPLKLTVDGKEYSLRAWVESQGGSYDIALRRWHAGERDPEKLIDNYLQKPITKADLQWLKETRRARKGMAEEWEIACDLIGQPRARADELRVMVDGGRPIR